MDYPDTRFLSIDERREAVAEAFRNRVSPTVLGSIQRLHGLLPASDARSRSIEILSNDPEVSVVATGQQVGLFGGPLLTIYKALTAVRWAEELSRESGKHVLPIFWLQGEDHDLREIDMAVVPPRNGEVTPHRISVAEGNDQGEQRRSVAFELLGDRVEEIIRTVAELLGDAAHVQETLDAVRASYRPGVTFQEAFVGLMAGWFGNTPLLFFNSTDPALAPLRAPIVRRCLDEMESIERALRARSVERAQGGRRDQVVVKDRSPLFFFHPDGPDGPRYRLQESDGVFHFQGRPGSVTRQELEQAIDRTPERFSNSALLRPLFQDSILPVATYIAGASEIQYLDQIALLYPIFKVRRPLVVPRASFVVVDGKIRRLLDQLQLTLEEVQSDSEELLLEKSLSRSDEGKNLTANVPGAIREDLGAILAKYEGQLSSVDPALSLALNKTREKVSRALDGFESRYRDSLAAKFATRRERVRRLKAMVTPFGEPQERVISTMSALGRVGLNLLVELAKNIDPLAPNHGELSRIDV